VHEAPHLALGTHRLEEPVSKITYMHRAHNTKSQTLHGTGVCVWCVSYREGLRGRADGDVPVVLHVLDQSHTQTREGTEPLSKHAHHRQGENHLSIYLCMMCLIPRSS
jgi:hypothetical protein